MFEPVSWFVEGGAEHSAGMARLLSYAAFNGSEGVIGSVDFQVRSLAVPAGSVRIAPGACSILNRSAGAQYEAYVGRALTETVIDIAPTTSSGGRSDMIVAMVQNPWLTGEPWPNPADPKVGPYFVPQVISGVSSTATQSRVVQPGWSAIPLARIDIPANTGTITQAMIKDLRFLSQARSQRELNVWAPALTSTLTSASFVSWPAGEGSLPVQVPEWATHAMLRAIIGGVRYGSTSPAEEQTYGAVRMQLNIGSSFVFSEQTGYDLTADASGRINRVTIMAGGMVAIPSSFRGQSAVLRTQGHRSASATTSLTTDTSSMCTYEVEWLQRTESMTS